MAVGKILKTLVKGGKRLRKPISVKENLGRSVAGDVIAPSKKGLKGDLGGKNIPDTFKKSKLATDKSKIETALKRLRKMKNKKTITSDDKNFRASTSKKLAKGKTENTVGLINILEARLKKIKGFMHKNLAKKVKESGGEKSLHGKAKQLTKKEMEDLGYNVARKHGGQIGKPRGTGAALRGFGKGYKKD
jgi:hypothetical protein